MSTPHFELHAGALRLALRPDLVELECLVGADAPDAPDATRTLDEMNAPGPLHGILGQNPARYASPAAGAETVAGIVDGLTAWVQGALRELGYAAGAE